MKFGDKWHFIFTFVCNIIFFCLMFFLIPMSNPALKVVLFITLSAVLCWVIHAIHEHIQANEPISTIERKYGSLEAFRLDQKQDWKLFWYGLVSSITINGLIGGLL